jgi:hypothetical protein
VGLLVLVRRGLGFGGAKVEFSYLATDSHIASSVVCDGFVTTVCSGVVVVAMIVVVVAMIVVVVAMIVVVVAMIVVVVLVY